MRCDRRNVPLSRRRAGRLVLVLDLAATGQQGQEVGVLQRALVVRVSYLQEVEHVVGGDVHQAAESQRAPHFVRRQLPAVRAVHRQERVGDVQCLALQLAPHAQPKRPLPQEGIRVAQVEQQRHGRPLPPLTRAAPAGEHLQEERLAHFLS